MDPFGPPVLNLNDQRNTNSLKLALPSTDTEIKYAKVSATESSSAFEDKSTSKNTNLKTSSILKGAGGNTDAKQSKVKRDKGTSASPKRVQISNGNSYKGSANDSDEEFDKKFSRNNTTNNNRENVTNFELLD